LLYSEKRLNEKNEKTLPLQTISVVALGFERVVWENVLTDN